MTRILQRLHSPSYAEVTLVFALVSGLAGCGGATGPSGSSGTPKGSATNETSVVATKPTPPSGTDTPASPSKAASPFHIVADVDYSLELQRLGNTAVLVSNGQLLPIRDNTVTFDPKFALSLEVRGDGVHGVFQFLLGKFPDLLFASVVRPWGRTGYHELYKWNGTKWTSHYETDATTFVLDIQPWQNGTLLMVETHGFSGESRFTVLPKGSKVFVPEPNGRKWQGASSMCESGFIPDALGTLTSGHVFMTGVICSAGDGPHDGESGVKHWSPDNAKGTVDVLPDIGKQGFELTGLGLHDEKDAYVGGNMTPLRYGQPPSHTPYLAHFDGKTWTRDTLPFSDGLASMDVDSNGKVWVVSKKGAIFSRAAGGTWAEITLPVGGEGASISATTVWSRAPGDEWLLGTYSAKDASPRYVVLHSGPAGEMAKLPDFEAMDNAVSELAMPTPLTRRCATPFVLLFTLSKVAPPDFDYPATREALKGHTEFKDARFIEFKRLDKRFMGAFVPDAEMGKKLVELVQKKVPNSTPQLACHAPKPSRIIEIDLSRGN